MAQAASVRVADFLSMPRFPQGGSSHWFPRMAVCPRGLTCCMVWLIALLSLLTGPGAQAQPAGSPVLFRTSPPQALRLCVLSSAPDVMPKPGIEIQDNTLLTAQEAKDQLQGISVDMIGALYGQVLAWNYTVRYFHPKSTGFSQVMYKTRTGECDVAVQSFFVDAQRDLCLSTCQLAPPTANFTKDSDYEKYLCCIDFSYPYFVGGWSFMAQISSGGGDIDYLAVFFQRDIVQAICVCIICLFFMAHVIWLIERTQYGRSLLLTNPKEGFSHFYLDGLKDGVWFSSTTLMNGVVNAEKTVITPLGRLITTVWILFGILMSAFITALIAASLTTAQLSTSSITTARDVAGKTVCMPTGFISNFFDKSFPGIGVHKVLTSRLSECFPMVSEGKVQAAFGIREESIGYFAEGKGAGLLISPIVKSQAYGMVWSQGWPYAEWVNEALLQWQQNVVATQPPYTDSVQRWYWGDAHQITYGGNVQAAEQKWSWGLIAAAIALVGLYMSLQAFVILAHWRMKASSKVEDEKAGTGSGKVESSNKSMLIRAATMIAAPPDALKLPDAADDSSGSRTLSRRLSFFPPVKEPWGASGKISQHLDGPGESHASMLPASGSEHAWRADVTHQLELLSTHVQQLLAAQHPAQAPASMPKLQTTPPSVQQPHKRVALPQVESPRATEYAADTPPSVLPSASVPSLTHPDDVKAFHDS